MASAARTDNARGEGCGSDRSQSRPTPGSGRENPAVPRPPRSGQGRRRGRQRPGAGPGGGAQLGRTGGAGSAVPLIGSAPNKGLFCGPTLVSGEGGRSFVKSVPVGVKPPGGGERDSDASGSRWEGSLVIVCELESRALERPGEGWQPPGPRPPRPRAGSWSCCCSDSRHPPRRWPATSRWGAGESPSAVSSRLGSAACGTGERGRDRRAAGSRTGPARGGRARRVAVRHCGGSGAPSPAPAWRSA